MDVKNFPHPRQQQLAGNTLYLARHFIAVTSQVIQDMRKKSRALMAMPHDFYRPAISNQVPDFTAVFTEDIVKFTALPGFTKFFEQHFHVLNFRRGQMNGLSQKV